MSTDKTDIPELKQIDVKVQKLDPAAWDVDSDAHDWDGVPAGPAPDDLTPAEWVADLNLRAAQADKFKDEVILSPSEARAIVTLLTTGYGLPSERAVRYRNVSPPNEPPCEVREPMPDVDDLEDDNHD